MTGRPLDATGAAPFTPGAVPGTPLIKEDTDGPRTPDQGPGRASPDRQADRLTRMDIGRAVAALKAGQRVTRESWDGHVGSTEWLVLVPGSEFIVDPSRPLGKAVRHLVGLRQEYAAHIDLYHAGVLGPWTPTSDDLLATDWCVVA